MTDHAPFTTIAWEGDLQGYARILDQTLLPAEVRYLEIRSVDEMCAAIRRLAVRGAPALGVAFSGSSSPIAPPATDPASPPDAAAAGRHRPTAGCEGSDRHHHHA